MRISAWQAAAVAAGLVGLGVGFVWGSGRPTVRTASIAAASASPTGGGVVTSGITVTGAGTVSGTPDALKLSMAVEVTRPSVSAALDDANGAAAKVAASLKRSGVAEKDLQTSGVSVQAQYSYDNNKQTITGYQVSESLTATLHDLKNAGAAISAAAAAGGDATRVNSVTLDLTDTSALVTAARAAAFVQAKEKATQYAKLSGVDLGDVVSVSESVTDPRPVPVGNEAYAAAGAMRTASPVPIQAGSQDVVVTVTVVYGIG